MAVIENHGGTEAYSEDKHEVEFVGVDIEPRQPSIDDYEYKQKKEKKGKYLKDWE